MDLTTFECFSPAIYVELKAALNQYANPGSKILDIGSNEGNIEAYLYSLGQFDIDAVDIDTAAIEVLAAKSFRNITVNAVASDANDYLKSYSGTVDMVLSSASIHEINNPENQKAYLEWFFSRLHQILNPGGIAVIGDLYFPDHVPEDEVEHFRIYQLLVMHHASNRREFVKPELIDDVASRHGFQLQIKKEIRAVKEIDRRYYVIVLEKI